MKRVLMFLWGVLFLVCLDFASAEVNPTESQKQIQFLAVFWTRNCEITKPCQQLPQAISKPLLQSAHIKEPDQEGYSTHQKFKIMEKEITADVTVYWAKPKGELARVVTQTILFYRNTRIAQCSWYQTPELAFPAMPGSCSGFVVDDLKTETQWGVSFLKPAHQAL